MIKSILIILTVFLFGTPTFADITLPSFIGHHMVVQRGVSYPLYGWASPGEKVTVSFNGQKLSATAGEDSIWSVTLAPMKAGGPYEMNFKGKNTVTLYNILIGDLWVFSGQSNMQWPVKYSVNPEKEIAAANYRSIRLFTVKRTAAADPLIDCSGRWDECTSHTAGDFSGLGYYFGREIYKTLDIPIGLVQAAWGGTGITAWTSRAALSDNADTRYTLAGWEKIIDGRPKEVFLYYDSVSAWFEYCFVQMSRRESYDPFPSAPKGYEKVLWAPGWLFNAMIAPLTRFPVTGIVWCQGENDAAQGFIYGTFLETLIRDWRTQWKRKDMPFIVVQLANVGDPDKEPADCDWAELRESQLSVLKLPGTGLAVTHDLGTDGDVHYRNKQEAGRRAALSAMKIFYGRNNSSPGPLYKSMVKGNGKILLKFDCTGNELATPGNEPLRGFTIAGTDRQFVRAEAKIEYDGIVVSSDKISDPEAVRYGWSRNSDCNLYNIEGLPASQFRTDKWPGITFEKR